MKFKVKKTGVILTPKSAFVIEQMKKYPKVYEEIKDNKPVKVETDK